MVSLRGRRCAGGGRLPQTPVCLLTQIFDVSVPLVLIFPLSFVFVVKHKSARKSGPVVFSQGMCGLGGKGGLSGGGSSHVGRI